jgi:hypothetical protein
MCCDRIRHEQCFCHRFDATMLGTFAVHGQGHSSVAYLLDDVGLWSFDGKGKITGTHEFYIQDQLGAKPPAPPDLCEVTLDGTYSVASDGLATLSVTFTVKSGPATCGAAGSSSTITGEFVIEDTDHAHAIWSNSALSGNDSLARQIP